MSGRVSGNSGVSEKVSGTFCAFQTSVKSENSVSTSVSNSVLSVLKCPKGEGPFWTLLGHLRHSLKLFCFFTFDTFLFFFAKCSGHFSDTPELPDTLPDTLPNTVLDTFEWFLKILYKAVVAHHNLRFFRAPCRSSLERRLLVSQRQVEQVPSSEGVPWVFDDVWWFLSYDLPWDRRQSL